MALLRVRWLKNSGAEVVSQRKGSERRVRRCEGPGGSLTIPEAAKLLGTNEMKLYRLLRHEVLAALPGSGKTRLALSELRRARREPSIMADRRRAGTP